MDEEKWLKRLEIVIKLVEILEQGKAIITWQDKTVIKIEKIETEAMVKK